MKKVHYTRVIAALIAMLLSFSACGAPTSAVPSSAAPSASGESTVASAPIEKEKPVTLSFVRAGTDERSKAAYEKLIEEYTKQNPHVTIEYQQYNFGSELETKLNTLYASGSAPDIVRAPISTIAQRASMGQYAELDSYINGWADKDQIIPNAYDVGSYKGHQYGIAINMDSNFLIYRKDHFIEAGLDPNKPPKTWEELSEYAEKLTLREGNNVTRMGVCIPMAQAHSTLLPFARQNGALLVDEEKGEALFNDAKTAEALDYLASYSKRKLLIPYINNKDQNPFELGKGSIAIGSFSNYNTIKASGVDWVDQIMFAPMVSREKASGFGGCQIMFLSEESKHKEEAWKFLTYLFSDEAVWTLVTDAGATPVKKALSDKFVSTYPEVGPIYLESLAYSQGMPKVEWSALFEKYICIAYEEAMYGKKDAQTALNDAYVQLNSELEK